MKKLCSMLLTGILMITLLAGCGSTTETAKEEAKVPDLKGSYKQTNSNSEDSYQVAAIDDDTITIYWFTASDQTTALYWTGTYEAPTEAGKYSWNSKNYHDLTDYALLASGDDSKTINYDNGEISYEVSMMGVTTTVTLKKSEDVKVSTQKPTAKTETSNEAGITEGNADASTGISSSTYDEPASAGESAEEVSKQLEITAKPTQDGQVAVFITNNSQTIIDELEVKINYLDSNNMVIDQDTDGHDMVLPGYTVVSKMDVPSVEFADAQIEYNIELNAHRSYVNHSEDVVIASNPGDGCVMVQITNNSDVNIDEIEIDVVLFKGEDVVTITYPQDIYDLGAGQSTTEKVDVYSVKTFSNLVYGTDYDRIEVYLNQAHTFGF